MFSIISANSSSENMFEKNALLLSIIVLIMITFWKLLDNLETNMVKTFDIICTYFALSAISMESI